MKFLVQHFLVFLVVLVFASTATAQNTLLHLDKSFYVTGEVVWYKFYLPQAEENKDAIVNVLVSDKQGKVLEQFYLQANENGHIEGYYKIPFDLDSDYYRISMLQSAAAETTLATAVFPIYNDLQAANIASTPDSLLNKSATLQLEDLMIDLQLNKSDYSPRETIRGSISIKDKNGQPIKGNISVAVSDAALVADNLLVQGTSTGTIGNKIAVRGMLLNEEEKPIRASVLGMYSSLEDRIFYCSANEAGQFDLNPPLFYGKRPVQWIGYQFEHKYIDIRMKERRMPTIKQPLIYSKAVNDYLALSQQRKKIFQIYTALESQVETEKVKLDVQDLEAVFTYVIDEYESFDQMRNFFGELITPLKFILKEDSTYRAELYNPSGLYDANTVLSGDPLFIIDGKLTRNADFVAQMDMDYIEEVKLMYKPDNLRKKFKAIGRSGVVKITTNLRDIPMAEKDSRNIFTVNGLQPKAAFPIFNPNEVPAKQPFFRPQLYWNPNLISNTAGKANFSFHQSDDVSDFTVRVVVQGENGAFGTVSKSYKVRLKE